MKEFTKTFDKDLNRLISIHLLVIGKYGYFSVV
jgi:hypothetical protein